MSKNETLKHRRCLVTGASRGIGRAIALALSKAGAEVIIHFHQNHQAAEELLKQLPGSGHSIVRADLGKMNDIDQMVHDIADKRIDVLVNNAGIYLEKPVSEMNTNEWLETWNTTIGLNLTGPAYLSFLISRKMAGEGGGRIINITSRGAFRGEPDALAYGASKAGLNSFGQSLAKALAPKNVLVFTVAPGFVETDMARHALDGPKGKEIKAQSPFNRAATPEEIANIVKYLAAEAPAYMTGSIIDVNGASYLRS